MLSQMRNRYLRHKETSAKDFEDLPLLYKFQNLDKSTQKTVNNHSTDAKWKFQARLSHD